MKPDIRESEVVVMHFAKHREGEIQNLFVTNFKTQDSELVEVGVNFNKIQSKSTKNKDSFILSLTSIV